jgi:hypothetical protein
MTTKTKEELAKRLAFAAWGYYEKKQDMIDEFKKIINELELKENINSLGVEK